jgi:uncharacterized membrane protein
VKEGIVTASPLLLFHVVAGTLGLLSGFAAMVLRKGARWHRLTGNVFTVSMLGLGASGAYLGFVKGETLNGAMGVLTFYLVATAWWTARRRDGHVGIVDLIALVVPLAVAATLVTYGLGAANSPTRSMGGYPAGAYFVFGAVALLLAAGDVRMLVRGGVAGGQRIARHLWRMGLALFVAAGSFFLGQQQVFPEAVRSTNLLPAPVLLTVALMLYWVLRVRLAKRWRSLPEKRRQGRLDDVAEREPATA